LTAITGMTAMAFLPAVPLAGVTAGPGAAAAIVRMTPASALGGTPLYRKTSSPQQGSFPCQSASFPLPCYAPAQIRQAYDIPANLTGAGETIAIVDAFGDPTVQSDLDTFDSTFDLPGTTVNVLCATTCPPFNPANPDEVNWASEISIDVQWAHAIAPGAAINLVIAKSDADPDLLAAQQYVVGHNLGDVLSQSFGEGETCMDPSIFAAQHRAFEAAAAERMTVFASAGDAGSALADCDGDGGYFKSVSTPASDPLVTGVGGTHLNADFTTGQYQSESVWNDSGDTYDIGAGGGGYSSTYQRPFYQILANHNQFRGVPDVSYNADFYGGVLTVCSECSDGIEGFIIAGGTSAGTPQWAGIAALADQGAGHRLGLLNPLLYTIAAVPATYNYAFHDILTGNNAWDVTGVPGYPAAPGWDPATGLGSPNAAHLIRLLTLGHA
jgi:subtilase family serine protease